MSENDDLFKKWDRTKSKGILHLKYQDLNDSLNDLLENSNIYQDIDEQFCFFYIDSINFKHLKMKKQYCSLKDIEDTLHSSSESIIVGNSQDLINHYISIINSISNLLVKKNIDSLKFINKKYIQNKLDELNIIKNTIDSEPIIIDEINIMMNHLIVILLTYFSDLVKIVTKKRTIIKCIWEPILDLPDVMNDFVTFLIYDNKIIGSVVLKEDVNSTDIIYITDVKILDIFQQKNLCTELLDSSIKWLVSMFPDKNIEFYLKNTFSKNNDISKCYCYFNAGILNNYNVNFESLEGNIISMNETSCRNNTINNYIYYNLPLKKKLFINWDIDKSYGLAFISYNNLLSTDTYQNSNNTTFNRMYCQLNEISNKNIFKSKLLLENFQYQDNQDINTWGTNIPKSELDVFNRNTIYNKKLCQIINNSNKYVEKKIIEKKIHIFDKDNKLHSFRIKDKWETNIDGFPKENIKSILFGSNIKVIKNYQYILNIIDIQLDEKEKVKNLINNWIQNKDLKSTDEIIDVKKIFIEINNIMNRILYQLIIDKKAYINDEESIKKNYSWKPSNFIPKNKDDNLVLMINNNEIIGYVKLSKLSIKENIVEKDDEKIYIANVDIREDYQNKGLCKPLLKNSMIWINSLFERKKEFYIDNASRTSYGIPACYCYFNAGIELGYKVDYLDPEAIKNYSNNDPELSKANLMVMNKDKNCIINNVPERMYYVLPHVSKKIKKAFNAIIFINKLKKSQASI